MNGEWHGIVHWMESQPESREIEELTRRKPTAQERRRRRQLLLVIVGAIALLEVSILVNLAPTGTARLINYAIVMALLLLVGFGGSLLYVPRNVVESQLVQRTYGVTIHYEQPVTIQLQSAPELILHWRPGPIRELSRRESEAPILETGESAARLEKPIAIPLHEAVAHLGMDRARTLVLELGHPNEKQRMDVALGPADSLPPTARESLPRIDRDPILLDKSEDFAATVAEALEIAGRSVPDGLRQYAASHS